MSGVTPLPTLIESRRHQLFPRLSDAEVERMRRFGAVRRYADRTTLFEAGKTGPGMFVVRSGRVAVTRRDAHGENVLVVEQGPGEFLAEVGQLSGRPALVDGTAVGDVETLLIPPAGLRALLMAEAELGERIMRALILRRVGLIESGAAAGADRAGRSAPTSCACEDFSARNGQPHQLLDPADGSRRRAR